MKIGLIQLNAGQDKQRNIECACDMVENAAYEGVDFAILPEVFNYRGNLSSNDLYDQIAENIPGESLIPLIDIAKKRKINILAGSIYERAEKKIYNTSIIIDDKGSLICKYRKINLFRAIIDGKEIDESKTYSAGDKIGICKIKNLKIGLSICFDLRFPELYRQYYNAGANVIAVPSSFTTRTGRLHWETLLRARAIENYCYILAPNQFGIDGNGVETYGHTMLIDPQGNVIDVIDKQQKGLLISDLSINDNLKYPFLN